MLAARFRSRSTSLAAVASFALLLANCAAQTGGSNYDQALARYKELVARKPFRHHFEGRDMLARTGTPEALAILVEDFNKPQNFRDQARYHIASLFGSNFDDDASASVLQKLRIANPKPADIWLWVNSLRVETARIGSSETLQILTDDKSIYHKAAALVALSARGKDELWDGIYHICINFPAKEADRYLVLGAMSGAVLKNKAKVRSERARAGMTAYISLLADAVKLEHTAKIQMARHLQLALNGPGLLIQPEPWLLLLQQDAPKKPSGGGNTVTQPRFFGIETEGERFCYVVDMSDSMLQEISPSVKPKGPVTGPKKKQKGELLEEGDLPWHQIKTRFDLAREHLKLSLMRLPDDKYFSIVWFGDKSGTLPSCPGLIKATKSNVTKVCKDLDAVEIGEKSLPAKPFGVLRGDTNLQSGLRRAFALSGKGFVETDAFIDPGPLTEGCDTIFLLSDGAPSTDDFVTLDKDYGEDQVVLDRESGAAATRTPELWYSGPYVDPQNLVPEVERMNTFRRVRIHGIGIGEADENLLRRLADIGNGQVYMVGKEQKQEPARVPK